MVGAAVMLVGAGVVGEEVGDVVVKPWAVMMASCSSTRTFAAASPDTRLAMLSDCSV